MNPILPKLYIIENYTFPLWCPIHRFIYDSRSWKEILFPKCYNAWKASDQQRFNIIQACYYYVYIRLTSRWMKQIRIKYLPLYWFEKSRIEERKNELKIIKSHPKGFFKLKI